MKKKNALFVIILTLAIPVVCLAGHEVSDSLIDSDVYYDIDKGWLQVAILLQSNRGPKLVVKNRSGQTLCELTPMDKSWLPRSVKLFTATTTRYAILAEKKGKSRVLVIDVNGEVISDINFP